MNILIKSATILDSKSEFHNTTQDLLVENGVITDAKFKTFGCCAAVATSSMATEMIIGKTIEEALALTNKQVMDELGGLPPVKVHCSVLAEESIRAALEDYKKNHA